MASDKVPLANLNDLIKDNILCNKLGNKLFLQQNGKIDCFCNKVENKYFQQQNEQGMVFATQ